MCEPSFKALGGEEGVKTVQFILGRWVEAVGMCLRAGDNVATRNPRSSAETWHASISRQQLDPPNGDVSLLPIVAAGIRCHFGLTITCFPRKGLLGTAIPNNVAGVGELRQENGLVNFRSDIHSIKSSCYRKLLLKNEVALM